MKHIRKSLCLILAVLMLASLTSAFAADGDYTYDKYGGYNTYMCIGDSIAAGYTVTGVYMDPLALGFNRVPGAYHDIVASGIEAELLQLGCSAFRCVELRYIVEGTYTDKDGIWNMAFQQAFTLDNLNTLKPYFISAIQASDIITINLGSNDILSYSYIRAMLKMYEDNTPDSLKAVKAKIEENGGDIGEAFLKMLSTAQMVGKLPAVLGEFITAFNQAFAQFKQDWNASLDAIYALNPDVQIITVGVYNPANNISVIEGGSFKIGPFMQPFVDQINQFLKSGQKHAGEAPYADVDGTETWPISVTGGDFTAKYNWCSHPTRAGHIYMASKIMEVIPDRYAADEPDPSEGTDPAGEGTDPAGGNTDPAGEGTDPAGGNTDPAGEGTDPAGEGTNPAGEGTNPAGEGTNPAGEGTNPAGEGTNPAGEGTNPAGGNTDPAGGDTNPAGGDTKPEAKFPFTDVKEKDWFYPHVYYCWENGLMDGMPNGNFEPLGTTTRAQVVTVLWRLAGEDAPKGDNPFTDCQEHWAKNAITWAYENDVVNGVSKTAFDPNANVTREQLVAMLYRYMKNPAVSGDLSAFKDAGSVSAYAVDAFIWAIRNGIIEGRTPDTLAPKGQANRAELATILHRFDQMQK